ncbi:MAG: 5'/3'-nucleotidase SurE [Rubripirellula sp.]|nr:5'/3'-nucleotidase SurE [Rubripirellula sp.]
MILDGKFELLSSDGELPLSNDWGGAARPAERLSPQVVRYRASNSLSDRPLPRRQQDLIGRYHGGMKVLLTNDDGVDAPGLEALYQTIRDAVGQNATITVVAPHQCRSECGHGVTSGRPLTVSQRANGWFLVDGTPVDCVRVAFAELATEADVVFSGVNAGANLGVDLLVSGTFAAAREAALHGVAAMAISHYRHPDVPRTWEHVPRWAAVTVNEFIDQASHTDRSANHGLLWNVNLPAVDPERPTPPRCRCPVDQLPLQRTATATGQIIEMEADFHGRPRAPGSDVERCFNGHLTISELSPFV